MSDKKPSAYEQLAKMTGFKTWKVALVLGNNASNNLHRVTDDEMAIILHAAAEIGYVNHGHGVTAGTKVKEVTLEMVAKRAGVTTWTVGRALQADSIDVSKETREHILHIAKELGYKPTNRTLLKNFHHKK